MRRNRPPRYTLGIVLFCLFWAISAVAINLAVNGVDASAKPLLPYYWCLMLGAANAVLWLVQWSDKS